MEKKSTKTQNIYVSEEEQTLKWEEIQVALEKNFGSEIYSSWLKS